MSKKVVLKLEVRDEKGKRKAMKAVSSLPGIDSLAMDMNEKKLTVIGNVDPVQIVDKVRKSWYTEILSVGPAKEPEDEEGGGKDTGQNVGAKIEAQSNSTELLGPCENGHPRDTEDSIEENPNSCVIC